MANWTVSATWTKQANGLAWDAVADFASDTGGDFKAVPFKGILSADNARRIFGNQIAQYEAADFTPTNGAFDMTPPAPPSPPDPTPQEVAAQEYAAKRIIVLQTKQDVDAGLATQADLDKAVQDAKDVKPADAVVADAKV